MNENELIPYENSPFPTAEAGKAPASGIGVVPGNMMANLSVQDILTGYCDRSLSPVAYMEHVLWRIELLDPQINAFFFTDPENARAEALESERRWAAGCPKGPLDGLPFADKDNHLTKGMPSPEALAVNRDAPLGEMDAPAIDRMREAGAILVGKNTQPELASLATTISGLYGVGRNPWDPAKTSGGSSGGSAAAVAADMVPVSIGGDAGGSIRLPASHCGVVGIKVSAGRIPRYPSVKPYGTVGPMVRRASDLPILMNVLAGPDAVDSYSLAADGVDYEQRQPDILRGKRIGFTDWFGFGLRTSSGVADAFAQAIDRFACTGAKLVKIDAPFDHDPFEKMAPMFAAGARANALAKTGGRLETLVPALQAWFEEGKDVTPEEIQMGMDEQQAMADRMDRLMADFDFLLTPTSPIVADDADLAFPSAVKLRRLQPELGPECCTPSGMRGVEGSCRYGEPHVGRQSMVPFTFPFNYSGHPAISIPCGFDGGLPVGLQVVGRKLDDFGCIWAAVALEEALGKTFVAPLAT